MTGNTRGLRADARRNRERLLEVAVRAFSERGADASLEAIAKDAGVGIGTLYRHFPTREALLEAAYRSEVAKVCDSAEELLTQYPPDRAMRMWMDRFFDYLATKQGMADALKVVIASGEADPFAESLDRISTAISTLLKAGTEADVLRSDVDPLDVGFALGGILLITSDKGLRERAARMLDLGSGRPLEGLLLHRERLHRQHERHQGRPGRPRRHRQRLLEIALWREWAPCLGDAP